MDIAEKMSNLPSDGEMTQENILQAYVETTFYECCVSAQYTANLQVLFNIEAIAQRMSASEKTFMEYLLSSKRQGRLLIERTVKKWLNSQCEATKGFFKKNDIKQTTYVTIQRKNLSCTIHGQSFTFSNDNNDYTRMGDAINLLRYPMIMMEKLQRLRSGTLLDIDNDACELISLADNFSTQAKELCATLQRLTEEGK